MMYANVWINNKGAQFVGNLVHSRKFADDLARPCSAYAYDGQRRIGVLRVKFKDGVNRSKGK